MNTQSDFPSDAEWEDIILQLTAFTRSFAKGRRWFRGSKTETFLRGKTAEDYVYEAIEKYLGEPGKFDPTRGDLIGYLKYNLVRTAIGNDVRKAENSLTQEISDYHRGDEDDEGLSYLERIAPFTTALFDDDIDYASIKSHIENEIKGDEEAESVLLGVYTMGLKRREIIEEFGLASTAYDNAMRRLNTVIARAAKFFNEKEPLI